MSLKIKIPFAILSIALVACGRLDITSISYESYANAQDAGALGVGVWLPGGLPKSAVDIRETHNVDTNEVWFSYLSTSNEPPGECSSRMVGELKFPRIQSDDDVKKFYRSLVRLKESGKGNFYCCRGEEYDYYLVVDSETNRAFGWSLGDVGGRTLP